MIDEPTQGVLRGVLAMDGPSGTGKSSVSRKLALALLAGYLDTGAMYRAATVQALRDGVDLTDAAAITASVLRADIRVGVEPTDRLVRLGEVDVSQEIRGPEVTVAVSPVSAVAEVRAHLVALQRKLIDQALLTHEGVVVEGRDIGTVVAPDAVLKVYLTASPEVRAQRRSRQDKAAGRAHSLDKVQADVERRDAYDSTRAASPLQAADDAVVLDTSELSLMQVVHALVSLAESRDAVGAL
jgi:cytidylate kinase